MLELKSFNGCRLFIAKRDARKIYFRPGVKATEYFSYCDEFGCDWEQQLNALPDRLDSVAIITLPEIMQLPNFSRCAAGVELKIDSKVKVPNFYHVIELPPMQMLYIVKCCRDIELPAAYALAFEAAERYIPHRDKLSYIIDDAPIFNYGATKGEVRLAYPVK